MKKLFFLIVLFFVFSSLSSAQENEYYFDYEYEYDWKGYKKQKLKEKKYKWIITQKILQNSKDSSYQVFFGKSFNDSINYNVGFYDNKLKRGVNFKSHPKEFDSNDIINIKESLFYDMEIFDPKKIKAKYVVEKSDSIIKNSKHKVFVIKPVNKRFVSRKSTHMIILVVKSDNNFTHFNYATFKLNKFNHDNLTIIPNGYLIKALFYDRKGMLTSKLELVNIKKLCKKIIVKDVI